MKRAGIVKKPPAKKAAPAKTKGGMPKTMVKASKSKTAKQAPTTSKPKIFSMAFGKVYPMYVDKAAKKGRSKEEVDQVICWLTGYTQKRLDQIVAQGDLDFETFFSQAKLHPKRTLITGKVCGVEVSAVPDPIMREIRYLDKLIDELAQGQKLDLVMRK